MLQCLLVPADLTCSQVVELPTFADGCFFLEVSRRHPGMGGHLFVKRGVAQASRVFRRIGMEHC